VVFCQKGRGAVVRGKETCPVGGGTLMTPWRRPGGGEGVSHRANTRLKGGGVSYAGGYGPHDVGGCGREELMVH